MPAVSTEAVLRLAPSPRTTLSEFAANPKTALHILPSRTLRGPSSTLHILDSSFNPPTLAHRHLALSGSPTHLLLLLSIQNADKAPSPASFEERLAMIHLFAASLPPSVTVDIGVTRCARFLEKSAAVAELYGPRGVGEQVYLTGFDTLVRILDGKYYPPSHRLDCLEGFFDRGNRIRCMVRNMEEGEGGEEAQRGYVDAIARGERAGEGCRREWAERIEMVENPSRGISSSAVRDAVKREDGEALDGFVTKEVKEWILERGLYAEE